MGSHSQSNLPAPDDNQQLATYAPQPQQAVAYAPPPPGYAQPAAYYPPPQAPANYQPQVGQPVIVVNTAKFRFDGGAATYFGTAIAAFFISLLSLGILTPWALCIRYSWRTKHTLIDGYRLRFTGHAAGLFGNWIKWWFLILVTLGIYSFWVFPRLTRWIVEHQEFDMVAIRQSF